jgi:hypothetical protein
VRTFHRICIEDAVLEAQNGDRMEIKSGTEYTTSPERPDGTVTVFGTYWAPFPIRLFAGERLFTDEEPKCPHGGPLKDCCLNRKPGDGGTG